MDSFEELTKIFSIDTVNDFVEIVKIIQANLPDKELVSMDNFEKALEYINEDSVINEKICTHSSAIISNIFNSNPTINFNVFTCDPTISSNILMTACVMLGRAIPFVFPDNDFDKVDWAVRYTIAKHQMPVTLDKSISYAQLTEHFLDTTRIGRKGTEYEKQFPVPKDANVNLPDKFVQLGQDIWNQVGQHEQTHGPFKYLTYEIQQGNQMYYYITRKKSQNELTTYVIQAVSKTNTDNLEFSAYFIR